MRSIFLALILISNLAFAASNKIRNSGVASDASIEFSKMEPITASRVACVNGSGVVVSCTMPSSYLDATSSIQTQIDGKQPLDGDLTAIAGLSGTNTMYYRSGSNTWTAVTIGANCTFSGGTFNCSGGGGGMVYKGHCTYVQTASCEATHSSQNSFGDLSDADCTQCTSSNISGGITAPGSNLLGFTITPSASTSKRYHVKVNGYLTNGSSSITCGWRLSDGTNTSDVAYSQAVQDSGGETKWFTMGFASGGSPTVVKLQTTGINSSGGCAVQMGQTGKVLRFDVYETDAP